MMQTIRSVADGLEQRLGLWQALEPSVTRPVPRDTASWWYVSGIQSLLSVYLLAL
jgi:hypothetical protein